MRRCRNGAGSQAHAGESKWATGNDSAIGHQLPPHAHTARAPIQLTVHIGVAGMDTQHSGGDDEQVPKRERLGGRKVRDKPRIKRQPRSARASDAGADFTPCYPVARPFMTVCHTGSVPHNHSAHAGPAATPATTTRGSHTQHTAHACAARSAVPLLLVCLSQYMRESCSIIEAGRYRRTRNGARSARARRSELP